MHTITLDAFLARQRADAQGYWLIDVREPMETQQGVIPGALRLPLAAVQGDRMPEPSRDIIFYCRSGKRSLTACARILEENPDAQVFSLEGGILAWLAAGHAIVR